MSTTMGSFVILFFALLLINFTNSIPFEIEESRVPVKRFNFNLLRTWQPLNNAEPFEGESRFPSAEKIDETSQTFESQEPASLRQRRIRQKLMCIAALQNTKACNDLKY